MNELEQKKKYLQDLIDEFEEMCKGINNQLGNKPCPRCDTNYIGLKWQIREILKAQKEILN